MTASRSIPQSALDIPHWNWPHVARVDNVFGDRNPVCSCVGMEAPKLNHRGIKMKRRESRTAKLLTAKDANPAKLFSISSPNEERRTST